MLVSHGHDLGPNQIKQKPSLLDIIARLLTREGRLVSYFNSLKNEGRRSTPAVILEGEISSIEVLEAPKQFGGYWKLADGRKVTTKEIRDLDTARAFAGYSF